MQAPVKRKGNRPEFTCGDRFGIFSDRAASQMSLCARLSFHFSGKSALLQEVAISLSDHLLFGKFRDKQTAWVGFRPAVLDQTHVIPRDNSIRGFDTLAHAINLLHSKRHTYKGRILLGFDRTDRKLRDDSVFRLP
jgi:hypothetical protein